MKFTGERLVPGIPRLESMIAEELARLDFVRSHFAGRVVLDAGCGLGHGSRFLAESGARWVLGVDVAQGAVSFAAQNHPCGNLAFAAMDCLQLALGRERFDMVCSIELIEHVPDTERYLAEICRVLKPTGMFYLSTPNARISSSPDGRVSWAFHEREFELDELRELLERYFAKVEIWGTYVPVYEDHPIRVITKSPLSWIKHFLPARIRVWVASTIRYLIKPRLTPRDVAFSMDGVEQSPTFVALCSDKRRSVCAEGRRS